MVVDTDDFAVGVESSLDYSVKEETPVSSQFLLALRSYLIQTHSQSYCQRVSERSIVYADDGEVASGGVAGDIQVWRKKRSSDAVSQLSTSLQGHAYC